MRFLRIAVSSLLSASLAATACVSQQSDVATIVSGGPEPFAPLDASSAPETATLQCATSECAPQHATCSDSKFPCDVDLSSDANHCGSCDIACAASEFVHAKNVCADGQCRLSCEYGYADCNNVVEDGCEQQLDELENCGSCGNRCDEGVQCVRQGPFNPIGRCGCQPGLTFCGGKCLDLATDDLNCKACGNACGNPEGAPDAPPNMYYGCLDAECGRLKCVAALGYPTSDPTVMWDNCNGDLEDGCEVNVAADNDNCGVCGNKCAPGQQCIVLYTKNGTVSGITCGCPEGESMCPAGGPVNGYANCHNLQTDPENCGACGVRCGDGDSALCDNGFCTTVCPAGFADCNNDPSDGCEVDTRIDPYHCGSCTTRCDETLPQPCQAGKCKTRACDSDPVAR
jgi:hypothetical protein